MVVLETTNNIFNMSLYDLVVPQSVLAWQRVRVANGLALNGNFWGAYVAYNNSGTYNNQYMVIDLKLFVPKALLQDGDCVFRPIIGSHHRTFDRCGADSWPC
jgi:hypothetical protein